MTALDQPLTRAEREFLMAMDEASALILEWWPGGDASLHDHDVTVKDDGSLVTAIDSHSQALLVGAVHSLWPGAVVIAEEDGHHAGVGDDDVWFIDPLDGTRCYTEGSDDFAVLASRWRRGQPYFSAIQFPAVGITAVAKLSSVELRGVPPTHHTEDIRMTYCHLPELVQAVPDKACAQDRFESTRTLLDVAAGVVQGAVIEMCGHRAWDLAAPVHLLMAAGRTVTDERGAALTFSSADVDAGYVVAADSRVLQAKMAQAVRSSLASEPGTAAGEVM